MSAKHTAIIYSVGETHRLYINVTPEEAARRWELAREGMNEYELALEEKRGHKVVRNEIQFTDEIEIWGNMAGDFKEITDMLMGDMGRHLGL